MKNIKQISIGPNSTIEEAIAAIQRGGIEIALVLDKNKYLIGTITDGDVRRAILRKIPLGAKVEILLKSRDFKHPKPTVAPAGTSCEEILKIMKENFIRHVPLLDEKGRIVELVWISELIEEGFKIPVSTILMAGGKGERLHPLTKNVPKPMLPLKNRPLIEWTIEQLRQCGISKITIATHYKSEIITKHFGNGDTFGVSINYIDENQPLGTAGALGLTAMPDGITLVINADILTRLNFRAMYNFHCSHKAVMTMGVRKCEFEIPYGVIELDDVAVKNIAEKPKQSFIVNAGIYLLEPLAYHYIPKNSRFDMPDLVNRLLKNKHKVICFPIQEYWLDIGHPKRYEQAKEDVENGKI